MADNGGWFSTTGERITATWAVTLIATVFLLMNPLMPANQWGFPIFLGKRGVEHRATFCQGAQHTPGGNDSWGGCWPGAWNTGVPDGVTLTTYGGSCTITTDNTTIDAKDITACSPLNIQAANVTITRSRMVQVVLDDTLTGKSVTISDSEIDRGQSQATSENSRAIVARDFTLIRTDVQGGFSTGYCVTTCNIQDSWLHHQWQVPPGGPDFIHQSAMRQENNLTMTHNSILCEPTPVLTDTGCSADITGYPDFAPIHDNTFDNNLFQANAFAAYCMYGGNTSGKPFTNDPANAKNIKIRNNIFQKGTSGRCADFGAVTDYKDTEPTNAFTGNLYDDGTAVTPG